MSIVITKNTRELEPRMAAARLITPFNRPRYYAAQNLARLFARTQKTQLLWVQCEDFPTEGENITSLSNFELDTVRRKQWLRKSDDKTGGIMGFMPLAKDLPVSFTQQLDKHIRIMKHTQGTMHGWTLHPEDKAMVRNSKETEITQGHLPSVDW